MNKFDKAWCYETIRQREQAGERFNDGHANELALQSGASTEQQLLTRAHELANACGLLDGLLNARQAMRTGVLLAWAASVLAGASAALASLGDGTSPVNVVWTIGSLLFLPTIMLLAWLLTFLMRKGSGGWLGQWLELLVAKVLNKGATASAWRAWLRMTTRANAHRWWLALMTHSVWFWVLTGMVLSLVLAFSLRHYTFVWQTTWLSEDVFVGLAQTIGALPSYLGFAMPDAESIRLSGNAAIDEASVRLAWANWLIGALLVFGWLPRLLLALFSFLALRRSYARYRIDKHDAYALQIQQKLARLSSPSAVDAPAGPVEQWQKLTGIAPSQAQSGSAIVLLEASLPQALHAQMPLEAILLPPVDNLTSRQQVEQRLEELKPSRLLVIVDARQTPDRGLIRTILALGAKAAQTQIYLLHLDDARARGAAWAKRLEDIGLTMPDGDFSIQAQWLKGSF